MLSNNPVINGNDIIQIADGTTTNVVPTDASWTELERCVNKTPNFFPPKEKEEYRVLDKIQALSIQGERPSIDGTLDVYLNTSFATAYLQMITSQNDSSKGNCFWIKVYKNNEARTIYCRCTIDDVLPNTTEESGGLVIYSLNLYNIDEAIEEKDIATPVIAYDTAITWSAITNASAYDVYTVADAAYTKVTLTPLTQLTYTPLSDGVYVVKAIGATGYSDSAYSNAVTVDIT